MAMWTTVLFMVVIVWFAVFLLCFMPVKKELPGYSDPSGLQQKAEGYVKGISHSRRLYNKTVIMLVDALRADFVFSPDTSMTFTKNLLSKNAGFVATAHSPTVTLPRIKALMTGSIPGFLDVILNFGSSRFDGDSILAQMSLASRRTVFYGDETWINLFSEHFMRSEGTVSFFVTDYIEVDNNVTRHLPGELSRGDFDLLILHYLGLDHIGHTAGPKSPLVSPKLREMDDVVNSIYQSLTKYGGDLPNLIILCGDHGMSDQGSHGGASEQETRVPLIFISTDNITNVGVQRGVDQIDLTSTLSELLGLPIPQNNLGRLIPNMLDLLTTEEKMAAMLRNTVQLLGVLSQSEQDYEDELFLSTCKLHSGWLESSNVTSAEEQMRVALQIQSQYNKVITETTDRVSRKLTTYDMNSLVTCVINIWMAVILLVLWDTKKVVSHWPAVVYILSTGYLIGHLTLSNNWSKNSNFILKIGYVITFISSFLTSAILILKQRRIFTTKWTLCGGFLCVGTVLHTLSLLSSSYVEEEHQTWYFLTITMHLVIMVQSIVDSISPYIQKSAGNIFTTDIHCCDAKFVAENMEIKKRDHVIDGRVYADQSDGVDDIDRNTWYRCTYTINRVKVMWAIIMTSSVLLLLRILRNWNQTGDKWSHLPDIGDFLNRDENKALLSGLVVFDMVVFFFTLRCHTISWLQRAVYIAALSSIYWYRGVTGGLCFPWYNPEGRGVLQARASYACIAVLLITNFITSSRKSGHNSHGFWLSAWILMYTLLVRPHNIILVAFMSILEFILHRQNRHMSATSTSLLYLWMGNAAFFFQGNSNSISTVDVGAGYIGLADYNAVLVGTLLVLSTYSGPIFWFLAVLSYIQSTSNKKETAEDIVQTVAISSTVPVAVYSVFVITQRYHLFVWTVFLPKLLYFGMNLVVSFSLNLLLFGILRLKEL